MACKDCTLMVFGVGVDKATFSFCIASMIIIANMVILIPYLQEQKVSYEACNELIANFSNTHACYEREPFNWTEDFYASIGK